MLFMLYFIPLTVFGNGFWELKREKKGKVRDVFFLLLLLIIVFVLRRQTTGFIFNYNVISEMNILIEITGVLAPFLLWCVANWSITTLVDGEGSFKDISITTAYALIPVILLNLLILPLSWVLTQQEGSIYGLIDRISVVWAAFLIFVGIMTIHQFSVKKTIATILIAILTMAVIVFLILLFFAVISQMLNFLLLLYKELSFR